MLLLLLLVLLLLLLMMMFVFSLWSCSALCEDSTVISSVSIPRIFGSVCTVSLKSTLQTLLPKSLSLPLMCGECCLSARLSLSHTLSLSPSFVLFLFELQLLLSSRHKAMPHSLVLTHVSSSKSSLLPFHFLRAFFLLSLCSAPFVFFFSLHVLSLSLYLSFLPNSLYLYTHAYIQRSHTSTHCRMYISPAVLRVKSLNVLASPET